MAKHLARSDKRPSKTEKHNKMRERREEETPEEVAGLPLLEKLENARYLPIVLPALLLIAASLLPLEGWMLPAAFAVPALIAFTPIVLASIPGFREKQYFSDEVLTIAAGVILFACGRFRESVLLAILFNAAKLLERFLLSDSRRAMDSVFSMLPEKAYVMGENGPEPRVPQNVVPGEILLVAAGERIPLDGVIVEGITTVDTAAVSGQRSPWAVNEGYRVYSGCMNLTSDIKVRVTKPFEQSTAASICRIAREAESFSSEQELQARRFNSFYVLGVVALAVLTGLILPIFKGNWITHLCRAAVLLIAARPAAEAFAIPLAYRKGLAISAKNGVFSKGEDCFESMARSDTMVFDKTGTITEGRFTVTDVVPVRMSEHQLLTIAAAAESYSRHAVAQAIREAAGEIDKRLLQVIKVQETPGKGVCAFVGERQVYVGNAEFLREHGIKCAVPSRPGSAAHVSLDGAYCGHILLTDKVRRRAFDALEGLRVNGVDKLVLLTGDVISAARPLASKLNFDMLRAELKPEDKAKAVDYLMQNKGDRSCVSFVGDGESDGKIMALADVGIAMGVLGSDAALAAADVLIMDRDIMKVPRTMALSRMIYQVCLQNMVGGAGAGLVLVLFGLLGVFSPLLVEIISFLLTAAVLINTLRIRSDGR